MESWVKHHLLAAQSTTYHFKAYRAEFIPTKVSNDWIIKARLQSRVSLEAYSVLVTVQPVAVFTWHRNTKFVDPRKKVGIRSVPDQGSFSDHQMPTNTSLLKNFSPVVVCYSYRS